LGRLEEALTALAAAGESREVGLTVPVAGYRALALNLLGRPDEALAALQGVDLEGASTDQRGLVAWQRGMALRRVGQGEEALVALDAALEAFGGKPALQQAIASILDLKAAILLTQGHPAQAYEVLDQFAGLVPGSDLFVRYVKAATGE